MDSPRLKGGSKSRLREKNTVNRFLRYRRKKQVHKYFNKMENANGLFAFRNCARMQFCFRLVCSLASRLQVYSVHLQNESVNISLPGSH